MVDEDSNRPDPPSNRLEREESQLWRWALWLLILLAAAVAALSWQQLEDLHLPYRLWAIPAGLFVLATCLPLTPSDASARYPNSSTF